MRVQIFNYKVGTCKFFAAPGALRHLQLPEETYIVDVGPTLWVVKVIFPKYKVGSCNFFAAPGARRHLPLPEDSQCTLLMVLGHTHAGRKVRAKEIITLRW